MSTDSNSNQSGMLFGHPTGLFTLFFAEMWERFSFYGMKALLLFYMMNGFLKYPDKAGYAVMGAYAALVYMTPFFGGLIADRIIGCRRAVILGGLLMAAGHLAMTFENQWAFFMALGLLITGNGFFKPNISTIVGSLYPEGSKKRDGGFTIFYIGVNFGAGIAPLLCGYIGQTIGWHYGFGLATIGMLLGVAVFVAPSIISQVTMFAVALFAAFNILVTPTLTTNGTEMAANLNIVLLIGLVLVGFYALWELGRRQLEESPLSVLIARIVVLTGALAVAGALVRYRPDNPFSFGVNILMAVALVVACGVAWIALGRGGLPKEAGAPAHPERLRQPVLGILPTEWAVYLGGFLVVPVFAMLVSGFAPLRLDGRPLSLIQEQVINDLKAGGTFMGIIAVFVEHMAQPAGLILLLCGIAALVYVGRETIRLEKIARERMCVVLVLTLFSVLFWAFFEQAYTSINLFTQRNIDRVFEAETISKADADAKKKMEFRIAPETLDPDLQKLPLLSQEQLGHKYGNDSLKTVIADLIRMEAKRTGNPKEKKDIEELAEAATKDNVLTITALIHMREAVKNVKQYKDRKPPQKVEWELTQDNVGMGVGGSEVPASVFQSVNPIYILLFGMVLTALWTFLGTRGLEPPTPVKFAMGILQLGFGFAVLWYGAQNSDQGIVALIWLILGYLFITTGELCLSPVGLSMVTKLSPKYLVATVMGMWFLATAFAEYVSGIIAQFTDVSEGGGHGPNVVPAPADTVHVYGGLFGTIAVMAVGAAVICFIISPILTRWMHEDVVGDGTASEEDADNATPQEPESE